MVIGWMQYKDLILFTTISAGDDHTANVYS